MKKHLLIVIFSLASTLQSIAQEIPPSAAQPSEWLAWFKSRTTQTKENVLAAKAYVNSKWRCLRYGENCSRKERGALVILSALATAAVGAAAAGIYQATKQQAGAPSGIVALREAVYSNNLSRTAKLLQEGTDPNIADHNNFTVLAYATTPDMVRLLVQSKKFNPTVPQHMRALELALSMDNMNIAQALLEANIYRGNSAEKVLKEYLTKKRLSQANYDRLIEYGRYQKGKKEFETLRSSKTSPLKQLPPELQSQIFEYTTETPLSKQQSRQLMDRSGK